MRNPVLVLFLAACLAVPTAVAAWGAKGDTEPNTGPDATGLYMYGAPNQAAANKVYLNGFGGMCVGAWVVCSSTSFNPNVGSLGTGVPVYPFQAYAMLGVWRDCNKDGYVGYGEQGLFEYRLTAQAAVDNAVWKVDTNICPVTPVPTNIPPNMAPAHNDGVWVREFLPIGWGPEAATWTTCKSATPNTCGDPNPYDFNDNGARVWADWGYPGDPPGNQCYARPHVRGTWHSVGGVQQWIDCYGQNRVDDTTRTTPQTRSAWESVRGENPDTQTTECASSHLAGLPGSYRTGCNPWGEESQKSYVDAFECTGDGSGRTHLPNNVAHVPAPKGAGTGVNPDGSMAGTMNETNGDFAANCRHNRVKPLEEGWAGPYSTEADLTNLNGVRDQHDMVMFYERATRPAAPIGAYMALGKTTSDDAGVGATRQAELWVGNSVTAASRNPYVDRATLGSTFSDVWSMTFYATVSAAADSAYGFDFPGSPGTYGSEACGTSIGPGQPVKAQWKCDPGQWWPKAAPWAVAPDECVPGRDDNCQRVVLGGETVPVFVRPGQSYILRDVDCWDHSATALRNEDVHYGVLSSTECS